MNELLEPVSTQLAPYAEFIASLLVTLVGAIAVRAFQAKVSITWGSTSSNFHSFKLTEEGEPINISTEKFYVQNVGSKAAQNIEVVFSAIPSSYNLWPSRKHDVNLLANGNFALNIPSLAPKELLIIETVDIHHKNPRLLTVNCPEAVSKHVEFLPVRQFGRAFNFVGGALVFIGMVSCVYLLLKLIIL